VQFTAWVVERHAIQQDQRAGAIGAARKYFGQCSDRPIFVHLQAGYLAQHIEDHRKLARRELLFRNYVGGDGGLFRRGFGAVGRHHHRFHTPRDFERDLRVCGGAEIHGARLESGFVDARLAFVEIIEGESAFGVAIHRLVLTRYSRRFHRTARWIENSTVNGGVFARAQPER